ncbi:MAG: type 1 glutamine amidotransferase [Candidatus Sungbacteria bacterium]|uniref:Type 1 glutamine amidotransferase n=1 Tax=Candidatus Sungiibacteriota bacterium TaxID=2750080 RepID=A0A932QXP6_9BACT|nr:type 1 glutamine amidotransferase [Candidatus Sungbacteria bacterium]
MTILEKLTGMDKQQKDNHAVAPIPERLMKLERVAIITADDTQDLEFFYPYYRLTEEGYTVDVITPEGGSFEGKHGLGLNDTKSISDVLPQNYALLYIPGGKAPATLRKNMEVLNFVKEFAASGKPIAAICHGPQLLISAGLVKNKQMAAWPEIAGEIEEAGGIFINEALVEDGQFITSRKPGDLHRHLYGVLQYLQGNIPNESRVERLERKYIKQPA